MVAAVRGGESFRSVASRFHVGLATVHDWVRRARHQRLDRVEWSDRPSIPHHPRRTASATEDLILALRRELKQHSALGEYGDAAIERELRARHFSPVPARRTIARILERRGALDGRRRPRRTPPPPGWYLPDVAQGRSELDSFDIVEGLVIEGGIEVEVLNGISLHGGLMASWPEGPITARRAAEALLEHWRAFGLPTYAQFDNDTRFQGAHQFADTIGRVSRLCLSLNVTPVFAPPRETGFQAAVESLNGRWQDKVWARFHHDSLAALQTQSTRYVAACRQRAALRIEGSPARRPFPSFWQADLQAPMRGRIVFLRRTTEQGQVHLMGRCFPVDPNWPHRLVRAEVDLDQDRVDFYALRRREPWAQPLLHTCEYHVPRRRFQG
jgi:transposase